MILPALLSLFAIASCADALLPTGRAGRSSGCRRFGVRGTVIRRSFVNDDRGGRGALKDQHPADWDFVMDEVGFRRRDTIRSLSVPLLFLVASSSNPAMVKAVPFLGGGADDRRQLELCLVNVLRVQFWADSVSKSIADSLRYAPPGGTPDKAPYLEARLGAKALLTGRVGGGANSRVYGLASFQIKGCLRDARAWYADSVRKSKGGSDGGGGGADRRRDLESYADSVTESLAACVEFDGLESTQDPSPRSTLMLSMYTPDKATFIRRTLAERTVPSCREFVGCFTPDLRERCLRYVRETYPNEVPRPPQPSTPLAAVAGQTDLEGGPAESAGSNNYIVSK